MTVPSIDVGLEYCLWVWASGALGSWRTSSEPERYKECRCAQLHDGFPEMVDMPPGRGSPDPSLRHLTHVESAPLAATMESAMTHRPQQQGAALMKRTTKYVGLDVHQASTVASVREEGGRVIARGVLPTDEHALTEFFHGMRGAVHVVADRALPSP